MLDNLNCYSSLTGVEEQYPLEAGQLHPVHIQVVQPVGQLAEDPEQHASHLWVLNVVLVAGEAVGQQHCVRLGAVLGGQLERAVLAPAGLEKLDLVVQTQTAKSRDSLGPLDDFEEGGLDALKEVLQLDVAGLLLDGLRLALSLHVSVHQHRDRDLGGARGVVQRRGGERPGLRGGQASGGGGGGGGTKLHLEVGEGPVHAAGRVGEHAGDGAGGGVEALGEVGHGRGDEVEAGEAQWSGGAGTLELGIGSLRCPLLLDSWRKKR